VADELKLPLATVAKMMSLSPFRAYRASISMKKKREIGVIGRPRALSMEAEEALSQEIVKCSKWGDPVSYATFQAKYGLVWNFLALELTFFVVSIIGKRVT
jgi:hypothetical protein